MSTDTHSIARLGGIGLPCLGDPMAKRGLRLQGFDIHHARCGVVSPWLRVAPGITAAWAAVATAVGWAPGFWWLAVIAWIGAFGPGHPFDLPYHALARRTGRPPLPSYRAPRRFAAGLAGIWSLATALLLERDLPGGAVVMGIVLALAAAVSATTHLCLGSWVHHLLPKRRQDTEQR